MFSWWGSLIPGQNQSPDSSVAPDSEPGLCANCWLYPQVRDSATGQYDLLCSNCAVSKISLPTDPNIIAGPNTNTDMNASANTQSTPVPTMCRHCKLRPKYNDGVSSYPYCGRTCANFAKAKKLQDSITPVPARPVQNPNPFVTTPVPTSPAQNTNPFVGPVSTTPVQNKNPFVAPDQSQAATTGNTAVLPGVTVSPFTRRKSGSANPRNSVFIPANLADMIGNMSSLNLATPPGQLCRIHGCRSPVYVGTNGVPSKYCSRTHKKLAESGCMSCRGAPTDGSTVFCQPCHDRFLRTAPMIVEVPRDHERYKSVASQFRGKWLHNDNCPEVRAIYKIVSTSANVAKYEQYRDQVEANGNFALRGKSRGNENRRWHGTTRKCNIGDKGVTKFCSDTSCSLCCIMRTSFDLSFFGKKTNFGRFGVGIYTSSTSSKSNDYSRNGRTSNRKAMLLNKVVVGKGYKMTVDSTTLTAPPAGYDSILAEVGASLNYDELVVYNNDAIRPSYLVMYDVPK